MPVSTPVPTLRLSQLAAALAHAVRNPLAGARASVERLAPAFAGESAQSESCARALGCLERIESSVNAIVELATPPVARPEAMALDLFAKRHGGAIARRLESLGCAVTFNLQFGHVLADSALLARGLTRALEYFANRGFSRVRVTSAPFAEKAAGEHVLLQFEAAGPSQRPLDVPGLGLEAQLAQVALASFGANLLITHEGSAGRTIVILMKAAAAAEEASS